jgi:photosystem II stability/assembly factor-like uncharacterized protein
MASQRMTCLIGLVWGTTACAFRLGPASDPRETETVNAGESTEVAATGSAAPAATSAGTAGVSPEDREGVMPDESSAPAWENATGDLLSLAADGGELGVLSAQPGSRRIIAGVATRGLFATDDAGKTWFALGTGPGSATINNGPMAIVYDPDHAGTFWEVGIYGDGVFMTVDDGRTFKRLGDVAHNDLVSVDFTDPARRTLLAGPHETKRRLWLSRDAGGTWKDIGDSLPEDSSFSTLPLVLDTDTFLVGSCGTSDSCGVFRSVDGGQSWTVASSEGPVGRPLRTSDGTIYWALAGNRGLITSADEGRSWTRNPKGPVPFFFSGGPSELPDGRVVTLGGDHLLITSDQGRTWKPIGRKMPYSAENCKIYGFTYSVLLKRFFLIHNNCSGMLLPDAIYSCPFDYESQ